MLDQSYEALRYRAWFGFVSYNHEIRSTVLKSFLGVVEYFGAVGPSTEKTGVVDKRPDGAMIRARVEAVTGPALGQLFTDMQKMDPRVDASQWADHWTRLMTTGFFSRQLGLTPYGLVRIWSSRRL